MSRKHSQASGVVYNGNCERAIKTLAKNRKREGNYRHCIQSTFFIPKSIKIRMKREESKKRKARQFNAYKAQEN